MAVNVLNTVLTVTAISLLIIVHEVGHLIAAKLVGMRVEVFSIGFWKKLASFRLGETEYRLSLVPLGGYVKVTGESPEEGPGAAHEFWSKSPGQRALFIVGGVVMNFLFALVLFIAAFAIGVPFPVAEVGETVPGESAWEVGLKPGDVITRLGDTEDPVFMDVTRAVALGRGELVDVRILRDGQPMAFVVEPRFDPVRGIKIIGVYPPVETVVSGLAKVGGQEGVSPAQEAGIEIGDRILAVNGVPVQTGYELMMELTNYPQDEVQVLVERDGRTFTTTATTRPVPRYLIGVSGLTAKVKSVEGDGVAQRAGLQVGDEIVAVSGTPVTSAVGMHAQVRQALGPTVLTVRRGGSEFEATVQAPDLKALAVLMDSVYFESSTVLTWVEQDGPAWSAGMRPGDRITRVGGKEVATWRDVSVRLAGHDETDEIRLAWSRGEDALEARVRPAEDVTHSPGHLGIILSKEKTVPLRYGALGAVREGLANTRTTFVEIFLTLRGFATREVSPKHMGGILTIAYVSYHAAQEGMGKLLYLTAFISAAIAFLNVLPIPVLDGGHLLFLLIEKVRGRRLSDRVLTIAQAVGFVAIIALVLYVTHNDIRRFLGLL